MGKIFICYSHRDDKWKDLVVTQLRVGRAEDPTAVWSDLELRPGDDWQWKIRETIAAADVAVILVSPHSLTSNFILRKEVPAILHEFSNRGLRIIPLILSSCDWASVSWINRKQVVPGSGALDAFSESRVNQELAKLAELIRTAGGGGLTDASSDVSWMTGEGASDTWRVPAELERYKALFNPASGEPAGAAADRGEALLRTLADLRSSAPDLADVVALCAVPRLFDAEVLGAVRGAPDSHQDNADLLRQLAAYPFVQPRRGGGFEYDAEARRILKEQLSRDRLEAINHDLATFYWKVYEQSHDRRAGDPALSSMTPAPALDRDGGADAYAAPLPEALHHLGLVSADAVVDFFAEHFDHALEHDLFVRCEALLQATRTTLTGLTGSDQTPGKVGLREARLLARTQRKDRAIKRLGELRSAAPPLVGSLRREALRDLGYLLMEAGEVKQARDAFDESLHQLDLSDASDDDRASTLYDLANIFWTSGDYERALTMFQEIVQLTGTGYLGAYARSDASGVLSSLGRADEAWTSAMDALHLSRTEHLGNRALADTVARRLMSLVGSRSPASIDTFFAEVEVLRSPPTARVRLDSQRDYADALRGSGQLARASALLQSIARDAGSHPSSRFMTELLLQTSLVRIDERRLEEGVDICSEALSRVREGNGTRADEAMARINRALTTIERIRGGTVAADAVNQLWSYVAEDAKRAAEVYGALGDRRLAALSSTIGELSRAGVAGDAVAGSEVTVPRVEKLRTELLGAPESLAACHMLRADIEVARERWASASSYYRRASGDFDLIDSPGEAAQALELAAGMAERAGEAERAATLRREVARRRWHVAAIDRYQPSETRRQADAHHARGILALYPHDANGTADLEAACVSFQAACTAVSDTSWWYSLNFAYAAAALGQWRRAGDALETSLKTAPAWWRVPRLRTTLDEFRDRARDEAIAGGEVHFREGRIDEAATVFSTLKDSSADPLKNIDVRARLALIALQQGDVTAAAGALPGLLSEYRTVTGDHGAFSAICRSMIASLPECRLMLQRLRQAESREPREEVARELRVTRAALASSLDAVCQFTPSSPSEALLDFRAIIVELGDALIPADTSRTGWNLFTRYIPAFSRHVEERIGVKMPPVRVRGSAALSGGEYSILIDEARVTRGEVLPDRRYISGDDEHLQLLSGSPDVVPAAHPATGVRGFWVRAEPLGEGAEAPGIEPIAFVVEHLEAVALASLSSLVGFEKIHGLIKGWKLTKTLRSKTAEPDVRDALTQLIRALLREQVPVNRPDDIVQVILESPDAPTAEQLRRVRTRLKPWLPGNGPTDHRQALPEWLEERLGPALTAGNDTPGGISPEAAHSIVADIGNWLASQPSKTTIVVRETGLRAILQHLLAAEFPGLHVLAQDEALETAEPSGGEMAALPIA